MIKLLWRLALLVVVAAAFTWLANRPGTIIIEWLGYEARLNLVVAVVLALLGIGLVWLLLSLLAKLWRGPQAARHYVQRRQKRKAYLALSNGIIAAGAGDGVSAQKQLLIAQKTLSDEPLVEVLRAQAAQLRGDRSGLRQSFETMLASPDMQELGLRGLFSEARQTGDMAAAMAYAEKAWRHNPRLAWAAQAMLHLHLHSKNWSEALFTLKEQSRAGLLSDAEAQTRQAAIYTMMALEKEPADAPEALNLALKAHKLNPALVPAALVAARICAQNNKPRKAIKIIKTTWGHSPHPDLATLISNLNPRDNSEKRFARVRDLTGPTPKDPEAVFALAKAAMSDQRWDVARHTLEPLLNNQPQVRFCVLMANLAEAEGKTAEAHHWLSQAITAPRDPLWLADGAVVPGWTAISPLTGEIVNCEWKVPYHLPETPRLATQAAPIPPMVTVIEKPEIIRDQTRRPDDPGLES